MINNGRGLFIYSDPGAAKAVLSQARKLKDHLDDYKILSNRFYSFTNIFGVKAETFDGNISDLFDSYNPSFLFAGTSYTSNFELLFIKESLKRNIPCYSFLDHYVVFKERFKLDNLYIFPNKIFVVDERAKQIAISEGILEDRIEIFGNPYYNFLKEDYKPEVSKSAYLNSIGIKDHSKKIVAFAPEPTSNINGKQKYGFDEVEAFEELKKILDLNNYNCQLILKLHPNQDMNKLKNKISEKFLILNSDSDVNTLVYYSDLVIGFFSNILIEAFIMGKEILRFHLVKVENDPIKELNIGKVVNANSLKIELECLN